MAENNTAKYKHIAKYASKTDPRALLTLTLWKIKKAYNWDWRAAGKMTVMLGGQTSTHCN